MQYNSARLKGHIVLLGSRQLHNLMVFYAISSDFVIFVLLKNIFNVLLS